MLEELRKKPKHLRQNYAFWGASTITLIIIIIWSIALLVNFENTDFISDGNDNQNQGAFSNFLVDITDRIKYLWQHTENLTETTTNSSANEEDRVHSSSTKVENTTEPSVIQASTTSNRHIKIATSSSATP